MHVCCCYSINCIIIISLSALRTSAFEDVVRYCKLLQLMSCPWFFVVRFCQVLYFQSPHHMFHNADARHCFTKFSASGAIQENDVINIIIYVYFFYFLLLLLLLLLLLYCFSHALYAVVCLASDPQCSSNLSSSGIVKEYDVIMMTCNITYSGNWAPVMRWLNSVTRHNVTDDVITLTTNDTATTTVTSQLSVVASRGVNRSEIVCVTYFTEPSPALPTSATNIPSYTYTWTSPTFNIIPLCK